MPQLWTLSGVFSNYIVVLARDRALLAQYPRASFAAVKSRLTTWVGNKREFELLQQIHVELSGRVARTNGKSIILASTLKTVLGNAFLYGELIAFEVKDTTVALERALNATNKGTGRINKLGFIDHDDGSNIRTGPWELGGQLVRAKPLPPTTPVFVSRSHPTRSEWLYVNAYAKDGIFRGYVQRSRVNIDLPEPTAKLYQLKEGDTAESLAAKVFSSSVRKGQDLRFYENVLLYVNQFKKRSGIGGSFQKAGCFDVFGLARSNVKLVRGKRIWLVSPAFAKTLEGSVPSGTLTGGMVANLREFGDALEHGVERIAQAVVDVLNSITESPRHVDQVLREDAAVIRENLVPILDIIALFLLAEGASAILAGTPALITQFIAIGIQLALASIGAMALAEGLVTAVAHGAEWLRLAIQARGRTGDIALASKEFLRMLQAIALAALSYMGIKGNWQTAVKIGNSLPPPSAMAVAIAPSGIKTVVGFARPNVGVATGRPGVGGLLGAAGAVMMHGERDGGSPSKSTKTEEEAAATKKSKDAAKIAEEEAAAARDAAKNHVHLGEVETSLQSPYHGKWNGGGVHKWDALLDICKRDGFRIKHVTEDPLTGVRRVEVERVGVDPKTKKPVTGTIKKTIYPKDFTPAQIDAAGNSAFESAATHKPSTKLEQPGLKLKKDGNPADGFFEATVNAGDPPRDLKIQGWYRNLPDGTRVVSSHTPAYKDSWPTLTPTEH